MFALCLIYFRHISANLSLAFFPAADHRLDGYHF